MTVGGGAGVELAKGYISLSIKYAAAMAQVGDDFKKVEDQAAQTGTNAGTVMGKNMTAGVTTATTQTLAPALKPIVEKHAAEAGRTAGKVMGEELHVGVMDGLDKTQRAIKALKDKGFGYAIIGGEVVQGDAIVAKAEKVGQDAGTAMSQGMTSGIEAAANDAGNAMQPIQEHAIVTGTNAGQGAGQELVRSLADQVNVHLPTKFVSAFDGAFKKASAGMKVTGKEAGTLIMGGLVQQVQLGANAVASKIHGAENLGRAVGQQFSSGVAWSVGKEIPKGIEGAFNNAVEMSMMGANLKAREMALVLPGLAANVLGRGVGYGAEALINLTGGQTPLRAQREVDAATEDHNKKLMVTAKIERELSAAKLSGDAGRLVLAKKAETKAHKDEAEALDRLNKAQKVHKDLLESYSVTRELGAGAMRTLRGGEGIAGGIVGDVKGALSKVGPALKNSLSGVLGPLASMVSGPMVGMLAGLTTAAGVGMTLKAGFDKADALDQWKTKMEVLGRSSGQVQGIVSAADAAVKDTTHDVTEMLSVAQDAMDSGGNTGLTGYLRTVADTATITGKSLGETNDMLKQFRAPEHFWDKVSTDALGDITKSGLPITNWLRKDLHMSAEELQRFVSAQGLTYKQLMDTVEAHSHTAAQRINHTFDAQFSILSKNITNIGEAIMAPFIGVGVGPFEGLNHQLEKFTTYLQQHQPEIIGFFTGIATAIESAVAKALPVLGKLAGGVGTFMDKISHMPGMTALIGKEGVDGMREIASALQGLQTDTQNWADSIVNSAIPATKKFGEEAKLTAGFNQALKDKLDDTKIAIAELNDAGGVEIKDATPGIIENLNKLKIHLKQIGDDPTHLEIVPDTDNAITIINKLREKEGKEPIKLPVSADTTVAAGQIKDFIGTLAGTKIEIPAQIMLGQLPPGMTVPNLAQDPLMPRSPGSVAPVDPTRPGPSPWDPKIQGSPPPDAPPLPPGASPDHVRWDNDQHKWVILAYGMGGFNPLPGSAIVQSAVHPRGLVQYAEPSTGGEAYIPLAQSKRPRSIEVWKQTGNLLGIKHFDNGGLNGRPGIDDQGFDTALLPQWIRNQWDDSSDEERMALKWSLGLLPQRDRPKTGQFNPQIKIDTSMATSTRPFPWLSDTWGLGGIRKFDDGGFDIPGGTATGIKGMGGGIDAAHAFLASMTGGLQGAKRATYMMGGFSPSSIDCSGMVSATVNAYLGLAPFSSRMTTSSEESWLRSRGFKMGVGPPGSLQVGWYDHGGGEMGHTALTLPDGTNAESTTSHGISGARVGPLAAGASSGQFSQHAYLIPDAPAWLGPMGGGGGHGRGPGGFSMGFGAGLGGGGFRASPAGFGAGGGDGPMPGGAAGGPGGSGGGYAGVAPGGVDLGVKSVGGNPYFAAGAQAGAGAATAGVAAGAQAVTGDGGQDQLGSLADIGVGGITESLLPPGFINPMNTPMMKSGAALMNFIGGLMPGLIPGQGGAMAGQALSLGGALMSGSGSGIVSAIRGFQQLPGNTPDGALATPGAGGGAKGGIDASVHYHGDVNGDMTKFTDMHTNMQIAQGRAITNYDLPRFNNV